MAMVIEHWINGGCHNAFRKDDPAIARQRSGPVFCCEIAGESWDQCMSRFHDHIGFPAGHCPRKAT